jgi:hypothetical protein
MVKYQLMRCILPLFTLLVLSLIQTGCQTIHEAYTDTKDDFFMRMGFEWFFVDYRDEGRIAIIWNNCNPGSIGPYAESWQELIYGIGDIGSESANSRQARQFEGEMSQLIDDMYDSRCVIDNDASIEGIKSRAPIGNGPESNFCRWPRTSASAVKKCGVAVDSSWAICAATSNPLIGWPNTPD